MATLKKNWKEVRYVGYETSISPYVDRELKNMQYFVEWDKDRQRGSFELYDVDSGGELYYGEGGLWFKGNELVDYDGVFSLDDVIIKCLEDWGADVTYVK